MTDCMMTGEWVLACLAEKACEDQEDRELPLRMLFTGLGAVGPGSGEAGWLAIPLGTATIPVPATIITLG